MLGWRKHRLCAPSPEVILAVEAMNTANTVMLRVARETGELLRKVSEEEGASEEPRPRRRMTG